MVDRLKSLPLVGICPFCRTPEGDRGQLILENTPTHARSACHQSCCEPGSKKNDALSKWKRAVRPYLTAVLDRIPKLCCRSYGLPRTLARIRPPRSVGASQLRSAKA